MAEAASAIARRRALLVAALATAVLIGYFATQGLSSSTVYYLTPTEAHQRGVAVGQAARLGGQVLVGTMHYDPAARLLTFRIGDGITVIEVVGNGAPPGLLREGAGAVVEGAFAADGRFVATAVIAKHDEVYTAPTGSAVPSHRAP